MTNDLVWKDLIADLSSILDNDDDYFTNLSDKAPLPDSQFKLHSLAEKLYDGLRIYYSDEDIRKYYAISTNMLFTKNMSHSILFKDIPPDIYDFLLVLISISKRLVRSHNINFSSDISINNLKKAFKRSIRSTIFLSTVANTNIIPKELLLSLDIDTLYRLVYIAGGQFVRVPTIKELDTLLAAVVTVSKVILENKTIDRSLYEAKDDFELILSNKINIQTFISKIIESYNFTKNDQVKESEPLINIVLQAIKSLEVLLPKIIDKADNSSPEFLFEFYTELSKSMTFLTDSLTKIDSILDKSKDNINKGIFASYSSNE